MRPALPIALALVSVVLRPAAVEPAAPGERVRGGAPSGLLAGASATDVTPPVGVPLAGYGGLGRRLLIPDLLNRYPYAFWFKPSTGVHDPIMTRALVLQTATQRVLWIAVDLVGTDPQMVAELRERLSALGLRYGAIVVAASHTHSGPGGFSRSRLFGVLALDRLVPAVRELTLDGMVRAAREADRAKGPARIGIGRGEVPGMTRSRVGLPLDPEVGVLKVARPDGRPIALLWNYAIHATALGKGNLLLSGDITGMTSRELERALGVPTLYTNGAVGDVSPALHGWIGVRRTADALAREVLTTWQRTPTGAPPRLAAVSEHLRLPPARLSLRNCLGRWVPSGLTLAVGWGFPTEPEMVGVAVGPSAWVTIPGELQTRLGQAVKAEGRRFFGHAFVVGISNDYAGYFLAPEEYARPSYIACASLYGEAGGEIVTAKAVEILRALRERADAVPRPAEGGR